MKTLLSTMLFVVAFASFASAHIPVPEIDPGSSVSALALIAGALMVIRGRRKA